MPSLKTLLVKFAIHYFYSDYLQLSKLKYSYLNLEDVKLVIVNMTSILWG